jgi:superfamily II DNA or RNA helicase
MTTLRPYQSRAVDFLAANPRALCICPAGGGKTIIGAAALAKVATPTSRIGWACNTREQVQQGQAALAVAGVVPQWVKCVAGIEAKDTEGLDFLVLDECHHLPAATWFVVANACKGTIWGLTATPRTEDADRDALFFAFWQDKTITIDRKEVMAGGHLASGLVFIRDLDAQGSFDTEINQKAKAETDKIMRKCRWLNREEQERRNIYRFTVEAVIANEARASDVVSTALTEMGNGKSVLVLVAQVEQGKALAERIPNSVVVYAKLGAKKRREAIEGTRSGAIRCMIATSLADEGLDIPRLSVVILATVGRSAAKLEQRTGRTMRPFEGKTFGVVYDYADRGAKMAYYQHLARLKTYKALGYSINPNT